MKIKQGRWYTEKEYLGILRDSETMDILTIAEKYKRTHDAIRSILAVLNAYKRNPERTLNNRGYSGKIISVIGKYLEEKNTGEKVAVEEKIINVTDTTDVEKLLDKAFNAYQEALVNYIEVEAEKRAKDKVREVTDKYERELQRVQTVLLEAKDSSIIGMLRKRFQTV